jgi:hypothetical protein
VSLSAQDLIVISTALICATGNGYLFVAAVHDGHAPCTAPQGSRSSSLSWWQPCSF